MSVTEPIKDVKKIRAMIAASKETPTRNYCFVLLALHTGLRMKDLLQLKKQDVFDGNESRSFLNLSIYPNAPIYLNPQLKELIEQYVSDEKLAMDDYLFQSKEAKEPISRQQASRIIKEIAKRHEITGSVNMHTLRKTYAYHAYRNGIAISLIQKRLHQRTIMTTKRYIGMDNLNTTEIKVDVRF